MLAFENASAKKQRTRAFTLVELLAVLGIIGVLVALLIPAVQAARESARRTDCANKLKNLALAVAHFETDRGRYPGYQEEVAPGSGPLGSFARKCAAWPVLLFPYLEEQALFDLWNDPNEPIVATRDSRKLTPELAIMTCPSDIVNRGNSYTANAGFFPPIENGPAYFIGGKVNYLRKAQRPANGIFHDRYLLDWEAWAKQNSTSYGGMPKTRTTNFVDGQGKTLLLAENWQSAGWWFTGMPTLDEPPIRAANYTRDGPGRTLFYWGYTTEEGATVIHPAGEPRYFITSENDVDRINGTHIDGDNSVGDNGKGVYVARPFSFHSGGGVNAAYADGHVGFLSETIPYYVYQQLMTPDGANSDMPDPGAPHEE